MAINFMLPLRATQLLFAIISLGLDASFANWYNTHRAMASPSQVNFLVFTSVWTILATVYLTLTPMYMPRAAHKFAILAIEAITMIFWFAGFIALAVFISGLLLCSGTACKIAQAGTVFGAFEWLLFLATTVLSALHVWRTRGTSNTKADPDMAVQV